MAGQSRDPQGTRPSTHQRVALTAVTDSGTNPGGTAGRAATAGCPGDGVAGSRDDAGRAGADPAQPASKPMATPRRPAVRQIASCMTS
jgi:hypothetical protein